MVQLRIFLYRRCRPRCGCSFYIYWSVRDAELVVEVFSDGSTQFLQIMNLLEDYFEIAGMNGERYLGFTYPDQV